MFTKKGSFEEHARPRREIWEVGDKLKDGEITYYQPKSRTAKERTFAPTVKRIIPGGSRTLLQALASIRGIRNDESKRLPQNQRTTRMGHSIVGYTVTLPDVSEKLSLEKPGLCRWNFEHCVSVTEEYRKASTVRRNGHGKARDHFPYC